MPPFQCPMTGGTARGPPVPLLLVPIVVQLVRVSCDPKMTAYLREVSKGGPKAIAENAHRIAQYALAKVPSSVLYWFTSRVLALPPATAMHTTQFLKSRSDAEILLGEDKPLLRVEGPPHTASGSPLEMERRLEKLELEYRMLQETRVESLKLWTYKSDDVEVPRGLPLLEMPAPQQAETATDAESMQMMQSEPSPSSPDSTAFSDAESNKVLQDVGLRLGRIFLDWAGDTMKQSIVTAASKSSANSALVGAGIDLASRLVDAVVA